MHRVAYKYLKEARERYKRRIRKYVTAEKKGDAMIIKSVLSWNEVLATGEEIEILQRQLGRDWLAVWSIAGNEQLDMVFDRAKKERPLDLIFGEREIARGAVDLSSWEIAQTTSKSVRGIIEQGLLSGASTNQIAIALDNARDFGMGRSRAIARTEATKAINTATRQAYQTATNEGIRLQQEWLSSRDDKVRPTHVELDGQTIGVTEEFIVRSTGAVGAGPGQFSEAAESINCRCTILPVFE